MKTNVYLWLEPLVINHGKRNTKLYFNYVIDGDYTSLPNNEVDEILEGNHIRNIMDYAGIVVNNNWCVVSTTLAKKNDTIISFAKSPEEIEAEKKKISTNKKLEKKIQNIICGKKELVIKDTNLAIQDNGIIDINVPELNIADKIDFFKIWNFLEKDVIGKIKEGDKIVFTDNLGNEIFNITGGSFLNIGIADLSIYNKKERGDATSIYDWSKGLKGGLYIREDGMLAIGDLDRTFYMELYIDAFIKSSLNMKETMYKLSNLKLLK